MRFFALMLFIVNSAIAADSLIVPGTIANPKLATQFFLRDPGDRLFPGVVAFSTDGDSNVQPICSQAKQDAMIAILEDISSGSGSGGQIHNDLVTINNNLLAFQAESHDDFEDVKALIAAGNSSLASIDLKFDVALSSRASEATLLAFKNANHADLLSVDSNLLAFKAANHTDLLDIQSNQVAGNNFLASLDAKFNVNLSTRLSEATFSAFATQNHTDLLGVQTRLDTANTHLTNLEGYVDQVESKLDTVNLNLVTIQGKQDTGNASLASLDTKFNVNLSTRASEATLSSFQSANHTDLLGVQTRLDTANTHLTNLETYTDGLEGLVTSTNAKLDVVSSNQGLQLTQLQAINSNTDGIETLIAATNSALATFNSDTNARLGATNETVAANDTATSGLNGLIKRLNQHATTAEGKLDTVNSNLVTIQGKQDTGNASLASIDTKVSTAANQATANASLSSIDGKLTTVNTNLTTIQGKQDTGNASLASIDTKVATAANQTTLNTRVGDLTETSPLTDTATSGLNGRLQRIAQNITSNGTKLDTVNSNLVTVQGKQDTGNASLSSIDSKLTTTNTQIGATNETAPASDTATSGLNGRLQRIAQNTTTNGTKLDTVNSNLVTVQGKQDSQTTQLTAINANTDDLEPRVGATNETAAATDTSTSGLNGLFKRLLQRMTTLIAFYSSNFGADSAGIRVNAQVGNSTGAASFGAGATNAQTIRVSANASDGVGNAETSTVVGATRSKDVNVTQAVMPLDRTGSGTIGALNASVTASTAGAGTIIFTTTGTWSATITPQGTTDGTNWNNAICMQSYGALVGSTTINQSIICPTGGWSQMRMTATAYTSGTATVQYNAGAAVQAMPVYQFTKESMNAIVWPGQVNLTQPTAGTTGAVDMQTTNAYGMAAQTQEDSMLALWGKMFRSTTNYNNPGGTVEINNALFRNPAGSGVNCTVRKFVFSAGGSGNVTFKIYRNPRITANGTAQSTVGGRSTGQATAQCILSINPTTSASGTLFTTRYASTSGISMLEDIRGTIILEPGQSLLFRTIQTLTGQPGSIDSEWSEQ